MATYIQLKPGYVPEEGDFPGCRRYDITWEEIWDRLYRSDKSSTEFAKFAANIPGLVAIVRWENPQICYTFFVEGNHPLPTLGDNYESDK